MYDRELLVIVEAMKQWRHSLECANQKVLTQRDNMNLGYFQTSKVLSRRQAWWEEILSSHDFVIEHLEGKKNPAYGLSRRPDYKIGIERLTARLRATLAATTIDPDYDRLQAINTTQPIHALAADVKHRFVGTPMVDITDLKRIDKMEEDTSNVWNVTT
jgi:hypothetical protein